MCGIIGVLANRPATPIMMAALHRLEYRGYDSAGVATIDGGRLTRRRAPGKLSCLAAVLENDPLPGHTGVGHTRWATHGAPTEINAHPHVAGPVAVVHNGIIENFRALRDELEADGIAMASETDTEVVAQLCAREMGRGLSPVDAASATLHRLQGAFALCFLFEAQENLLVCARRGPPLAIGYGDGEMFVGSDALALAGLTDRIAYLEDGDWAAVTRDTANIFDADGLPVQRVVRTIAVEADLGSKAGHRHFMAKEIHEQPAIAAAIAHAFIEPETGRVRLPVEALDWAGVPWVSLVACGTAHYACLVAQYWFEQVARLPAAVDIASEFRYRDPALMPGGVAIFVSQSGETADTLAALRFAREAGQTIVAVVNVETSSIAREADIVVPIMAGTEIGVASTKAFVAQLMVLAGLAVLAGRDRGHVSATQEREMTDTLSGLPAALSAVLACEPALKALAQDLSGARSILYIGRGLMYPMALEGALKLKELTYIHAEGYAAGELKHGPIALIDEDVPVVVLAPDDRLLDKTVSNLQEVIARKGRVALLGDEAALQRVGLGLWRAVSLPRTEPFTAPIVYAVAVQLIAYHTAVAKGTDVDQPRNLAKSVTVE
jgi:glucosamine--fructose-6-phosphate aminotransferase (isomerizing)